MDMFCFASRSERNIKIEIDNKLWAVAQPPDPSEVERHITKSWNLQPGSRGLLYCSETKVFTTPFICLSDVEHRDEEFVWRPEKFWLPFTIQPLGNLSKQVPAEIAKDVWPFLKGGLSRVVSPVTVFARIQVAPAEWDLILRDLSV